MRLRSLMPCLCVALAAAPLLAASPDVTALYPAGAQQGTTIKLALLGKVEPDKLKLWCDRPGIELVAPDGKDAVQLKIAPEAAPGWCWLGFYSAEGASPQRPFYVGTLPEIFEEEPNNRIGEKTLTLPVVINGVLQKSGDVDVFPFPMTAGQTVVASITAKQLLGSPVDCVLQLIDRRGFVLVQSDDAHDFDPQLAFTAKSDGLYAARVFGFPATPDSSIRFTGSANDIYRLTVTTGPAVTRVVPPVVVANTPAHVMPEGWSIPSDSAIDVPPLYPGVHRIESQFGPTTARVFATSLEPIREAKGQAEGVKPPALMTPACVTGQILSQRDAAFSFTAKKDEKLALRVLARAIGSPLDAVLRVSDAAGKTLQEVDDAVQGDFDIVLEFTPPADGEYVASVRDRFSHGGSDYLYVMTLAAPEPDFALSVPNDSLTFTPDKDFELTVNVDSLAGFDDEVELSLLGLPEGCAAEPVKITPKAITPSGRSGRSGRRGGGTPASAAKLVVKTTKTDGWEGEIRVVGRTLDEKPIERFAVGKPANTDTPRPHLRAVIVAKP